MSKFKFLSKWKVENDYKKPYSPSNEMKDIEIEENLPSDEPSSPLSITFEEDDINEENFIPQITSSPIPEGKFKYFSNLETFI